MPLKPRKTIEDTFAEGLECAICGAVALKVTHMANLPDYVTCGNCSSVFVLEDGGDRAMYGRVPPEYPETQRFALKQWAWLEAIARKAAQERPRREAEAPAVPPWALPGIPEEPSSERAEVISAPQLTQGEALPPAEPAPAPARMVADLGFEEPLIVPRGVPETPEARREAIPSPAASAPPGVSAPVVPEAPIRPKAGIGSEPPSGERFRVVLRGSRFRLPMGFCAHCMALPAPYRLKIPAGLPVGLDSVRRVRASVSLPVCVSCQRRAQARSPAGQGARLQAVLVSVFTSLAVMVIAMAANLVSFEQSAVLAAATLASLGIVGFSIPAWLLLGRTGRSEDTPDALYVRSTLRLPDDVVPPDIAFEWRNRGYAARFLADNRDIAAGDIIQVPDLASEVDVTG